MCVGCSQQLSLALAPSLRPAPQQKAAAKKEEEETAKLTQNAKTSKKVSQATEKTPEPERESPQKGVLCYTPHR